ncbi:MAG: hypothetical protein ACRDNI_06255 [Gaiellaceae bacterium]
MTYFKTHRIAVVVALVVGLLAIGGGAAIAAGGDDDATERPITGSALARAEAAALAHTGEGRVTGTEVGDEESYYEVEVTLDDGSQVDVQLDESFDVVGSENDRDEDED